MFKNIIRILRFTGSYALTTILLLLLIALTIFGTVEQKNMGLYQTTQRYFHSLFFFLRLGPLFIPFPGAYAVLCALFINIVVRFTTKFRWRWNAVGMVICHAGLLMLLVGAFITHHFSREGYITLREHQETGEFTEAHNYEFLVAMTSDVEYDDIVSFSEKALKKKRPLASSLPFSVKLLESFANCRPHAFSWKAPDSWKNNGRGYLMLGSYLVVAGKEKATCQLFELSSIEGSAIAYVNDWRKQLGMPGITGLEETSPIKIAGFDGIFVDLTNKKKGILGVIVTTPHENFIIEMSGSSGAIADIRPQFMEFCRSFTRKSSPNTGLFEKQILTIEPAPDLAKQEIDQGGIRVELLCDGAVIGQVSLIKDFPIHVVYRDKHYTLLLRKEKCKMPFRIRLLSCARENYPGTEIPRRYESKVQLVKDDRISRDIVISMNNPLRYGGYTFYQSGFEDRGIKKSTLSVVNNKAEKWPYFSCLLILLGMVMHFTRRLIRFLSRTGNEN